MKFILTSFCPCLRPELHQSTRPSYPHIHTDFTDTHPAMSVALHEHGEASSHA